MKAFTRWSFFSVVLLLQEIKHRHSSATREHSKTQLAQCHCLFFKMNVKPWKSRGFRINSKRINRLPLSWPHWTTCKPLSGFVCSKQELCSMFVVIVGRQWSDQILIHYSASLISVYHRLCWMKYCSFFLHQWQLPNNESSISQCIKGLGVCEFFVFGILTLGTNYNLSILQFSGLSAVLNNTFKVEKAKES